MNLNYLIPPILDIQHLTITFQTDAGKVTAVNDLSFSLQPGQTLGIVGESGSGKSVTSLASMGLLPGKISTVDNGSIAFNSPTHGRLELTQTDENIFRQLRGKEIAMIFQEPMTALNPVFTCGMQVAESMQIHLGLSPKEAKSRTIDWFQKVELPHPEKLYDRYPHEISGGQKQRVMIAMTMCCEPALIIADEPTTALDVTVQNSILALLNKLQKEQNTAIIFISHDLGVIGQVADEVLVMYKGERMEYGDVITLFENPQHPYTKGLLACRPTLTTEKGLLPTVSDFMEVTETGVIKEKTGFQPSSSLDKEKLASETLLEIKNLSKHYPTRKSLFGNTLEVFKAVDEVSFSINKGETIGLVGESGCGKTTLGRCILRLIEPTSGEVRYQNKNLLTSTFSELKALRKELQVVFQDPYSSLNPRMTVGQLITEPMKIHGLHGSPKARKEKAEHLLERVGLQKNHFQRYPHEFSGGQRQRICIARTLAIEPQFVICDESVSALDVSVQAQVLNLLNELKNEFGFTYLFISHDLSVVKFMADRLLVMQRGKVVEQGQANDIYRNPKSSYTQQLIEAIPTGELEDIRQAYEQRHRAS